MFFTLFRYFVNKNILEKEVARLDLQYHKNLNLISELDNRISKTQRRYEFFVSNREAIENFENLVDLRNKSEKDLKTCNEWLRTIENSFIFLYKEHGSLTEKLENLEKAKNEKDALLREWTAYDLFMKCFHSNGIAFDLIKKNLPQVNREIAKILNNVVEFEVFFENNENKLDIFIKHPRYEPRPLENGSGAEKTLASMAIRIALINISNIPKPNIFIMDEPGTALDVDNMEGFTRILDMLKNYFEITILISHIDQLKDAVDSTIEISKIDGYAHIEA